MYTGVQNPLVDNGMVNVLLAWARVTSAPVVAAAGPDGLPATKFPQN